MGTAFGAIRTTDLPPNENQERQIEERRAPKANEVQELIRLEGEDKNRVPWSGCILTFPVPPPIANMIGGVALAAALNFGQVKPAPP